MSYLDSDKIIRKFKLIATNGLRDFLRLWNCQCCLEILAGLLFFFFFFLFVVDFVIH